MPPSPIYTHLAPMSAGDRLKIASRALHFFNPVEQEASMKILGRPYEVSRLESFSGADFLAYLKKLAPTTEWDRYMFQIEDLLHELAEARILRERGRTNELILAVRYMLLREFSALQLQGVLMLAPALGPEFIRDQFASVTFQLTGINSAKEHCAGTGLLIAPNWLLTCAHVLNGLTVAVEQESPRGKFKVIRSLIHKKVDVALVEISPAFPCRPGLAFRNPRIAEEVYTLGYPRIHYTREPALVMQRGEITLEETVTFPGQKVFLYSAIARPGNSGGPVISSSGYVVGIVSEHLLAQSEKLDEPFFAGVGATTIRDAVRELSPEIPFPLETYL